MKLLDILLEDVEVPFKKKCIMNITNNDGETISVDCEVPKTEEEKISSEKAKIFILLFLCWFRRSCITNVCL